MMSGEAEFQVVLTVSPEPWDRTQGGWKPASGRWEATPALTADSFAVQHIGRVVGRPAPAALAVHHEQSASRRAAWGIGWKSGRLAERVEQNPGGS
jgi:hypothetical protein